MCNNFFEKFLYRSKVDGAVDNLPLEFDHLSNGDKLKRIYDKLVTKEERQKVMESRINSLQFTVTSLLKTPDADLPVRLPLRTTTDLEVLNIFLDDSEAFVKFVGQIEYCHIIFLLQINFLQHVGGLSYKECTRNIMRTLFASNLLQEINWQGKNEKAGIAHLNICTAAISKSICYLIIILSLEAVMKFHFPGSTHENVKREMARYIQKKNRK